MMSDLVERARAVEGIAPNGSLISDMADEIERLTAAFKLAHEQARSNALEIKARGNQLAAANKRIAEIEATNRALRMVLSRELEAALAAQEKQG
jgi:hypothetical protein